KSGSGLSRGPSPVRSPGIAARERYPHPTYPSSPPRTPRPSSPSRSPLLPRAPGLSVRRPSPLACLPARAARSLPPPSWPVSVGL
ncbi:hypothetical protein PTTG_11609, partial [Puccinia triticina 1-1 BBBD Race 1]